jgi:hypothetical protein
MFLGMGWDWVHLVRWPLFDLLYQPRMIDYDECGAVGMRIGRGNRSTQRKPAPVPLCPPQIPHNLTWAATVGSWQLTAWAVARPPCSCNWITWIFVWIVFISLVVMLAVSFLWIPQWRPRKLAHGVTVLPCSNLGWDTGYHEEYYLLRYNAVLLATCFHAGFRLGWFFDPEDGGDMFPRNLGWPTVNYMVLYPRRQYCS